MQIGTGRFHKDVLQLLDFGTGGIFSAPSGLVQQILILGHTFLDQNAVGEGGQVWSHHQDCQRTNDISQARRQIPNAGLNGERIHQGDHTKAEQGQNTYAGALFLLDVLTVLGNRIDTMALQIHPRTNKTSTLNWPKEEPTSTDMILWKEALEDICPSRQRLNCLGQYVAKSHRV